MRWSKKTSTPLLIWDGEFEITKDFEGHRLVHYPTFPPTQNALKAAVGKSIGTIWTLHDLTWWKNPNYASFLGRNYYLRLGNKAVARSHLITPSQAVREEVISRFECDPTQVTVIPNGISDVFISTPEKVEAHHDLSQATRSRPYLLFVGTIEPRKNLARTLQAFMASGASRTHDLWLVGRQGWGQLPQGSVVKGVMNDKQLKNAYLGASATLLFSFDEGFGLPVVESLACGTKVVVSDIKVFRELRDQLIFSGDGGDSMTLVNPLSLDDMAAAIQTACQGGSSATKQAQEWAQGLSWQKSSDSHLSLYRQLAN